MSLSEMSTYLKEVYAAKSLLRRAVMLLRENSNPKTFDGIFVALTLGCGKNVKPLASHRAHVDVTKPQLEHRGWDGSSVFDVVVEVVVVSGMMHIFQPLKVLDASEVHSIDVSAVTITPSGLLVKSPE